MTPAIISTPPRTDASALGAEDGDETEAFGASGEGEAADVRRVDVVAAMQGARLDRCLADALRIFSRSYLQQLIEQGAVTLNGRPALRASSRVRIGDRVDIELRPTAQAKAFLPEHLPLNVVYEDEHLLVLNKDAGMVVHPAPGNWSGTLLNGLLGRDPSAADLPRAGIVHRLDKDTSGLMVVARSRLAMDALVQAIAARTVQRRYLAIAHGHWAGPARVTVDAAIGRDPRNRLRMAVVDLTREAGKPARTDIEPISSGDDACLVRCTLHTGRTHQIRVHMAHLGHPLLADSQYGGKAGAGLQRQALHAYSLAFKHPVTGMGLAFHAALPEDMARAVGVLGLDYNPDQTGEGVAIFREPALR